jgi:hypothetical protein
MPLGKESELDTYLIIQLLKHFESALLPVWILFGNEDLKTIWLMVLLLLLLLGRGKSGRVFSVQSVRNRGEIGGLLTN